jgi:hypothetical protein
VKFLRLFVNCLVLALALAAVLAALALAPVVQTWVAQAVLDRQPGFHASLGLLSARFGKARIAELQLKSDGVVLTVPSLEAELPLMTALRDRKLLFRRLVAKGWTLDLRQASGAKDAGEKKPPAPAPEAGKEAAAQAESVQVQEAVRVFRGTLSRLALPCDVSLDGAELEGDVVLPAPVGTAPVRLHVIIKGGGMAAGREGAFTFDASGDLLDAALSEIVVAGRGDLAVAMKSPRTFGRVGIKADINVTGGPFPNGVGFFADAAAAVGDGEETFSLDLSRGGHHLAAIVARCPEGQERFAGTWKLDVQDPDVALFAPDRALPRFRAAGEGRFDSDIALTRVRAAGHLNATTDNPGVIASVLERLGAVTVDADFDATRSGESLRVENLNASVTGTGPAAVVQSLQPFEVDEHTGELKPVKPADDWIRTSVRGIPLAWLPGLPYGLTLSGGDVAGEFIVRTDKGGFSVRSTTPATAAAVSVQRAARTLAGKLDLALSLTADYGADQWHFQAAPLVVASGGSRLATIEAKASSPAGPDEPVAISGTWSADFDAIATGVVAPDLAWLSARSASGEFTAKAGSSLELDGRITVVGHDERHSITATVHTEVDADGRISFQAPVKVSLAPGESELSAEGTWISGGTGARFYLRLKGKDVFMEHLRLLADSLAAAEGAPLVLPAGAETPAGVRDRVPFWGDWGGQITVAFDQVKAGGYVLKDVGGVLKVDQGSVHLEGGQGSLGERRFTNVEGSISFDPAAGVPYSFKATAALDKIDVGGLFPAVNGRGDPLIEGQFSLVSTVTGGGVNLRDLAGGVHEEFRLTSTAGIVRVFKTDVDEAMPSEKTSAVSDTLGRMGNGIGTFFGADDQGGVDRRKISPVVEAVLGVINDVSEIGYDQVTLTAVQETDGTIRLVDIVKRPG